MIKIDEYMSSPVITARSDDTLDTIAKLMDDNNIGSIVVVEKGGVVGILTERDIVRKVLAQGGDIKTMTADDVMTKEVFCLGRDASLLEVASLMKEHTMRRLVILDKEKPVGIVTSRDLINLLI